MTSTREPYRPKHPILVIFAALIFALAVGALAKRLAYGQETDGPVIYRECLRPPDNFQWGRFPECGIDEEATEALRRQIEESTRALTPEQDRQVDEYIDRQYGGALADERRAELLAVLSTARGRIAGLLASDTLRFTTDQRAFLLFQTDWLEEQSGRLESAPLSSRELQDAKAAVGDVLRRVHEIVLAAQREAAVQVPAIENLVTRIDALVARVGTVIRDLQREGAAVPRTVRDGHAHALALVRESKRTCSTHRPAGCRQLREVLETIEAMREPLCALRSDLLTFCN